MEFTYDDFRKEPWSNVIKMDIEVHCVNEDLSAEYQKMWMSKTTVTIAEMIEMGMVFFEIWPPYYEYKNEPVIIDISCKPRWIASLSILRLHCKAGLVLKSPDDISSFLIENYNPLLELEGERKIDRP